MVRTTTAMAVLGLAGLAVLSSPVWLASLPAPASLAKGIETLPDKAAQLRTRSLEALAASYRRAPVAVIGMATVLALPGLGIVALSGRGVRRWRRRRALRNAGQRIEPHGQEPARPRAAWLGIEGRSGHVLPASLELLRIGRDADNDITITGPAVSSVHALIRRTPEAEYVVIDVSGAEGGGLTVNDARPTAMPLRDGDRIALGGTRLVFRRAEPGTRHGPRWAQ